MTDPTRRFDPALEDLAWLRELARRLVQDPGEADDVVQDTLVVALTKRPERVDSVRAWLSTVLRNLVRQTRRGTARREARERSVMREETERATADVVAQLAWHRALVDRVHALDEPYRRTLVRRFLEEQSPRAIARDEGVPVKTVHTRIARGLERLRRDLDREHDGDRRAWVLGLLPLTRKTGGGPALAATTAALLVPMNLKSLAALAAVVGLVSLPFVLREDPDVRGSSRDEALPPAVASLVEPLETPADLPRVARSGRVREGMTASVPEPPVVEAPRLVEGTVRDLHGAPLSDVEVVFEVKRSGAHVREPRVAPVRSAVDGAFVLALPHEVTGAGQLDVDDPAWAAVSRPYVGERGNVTNTESHLIVVAPSNEYAGRVVGEDGRPIEGARLEVTIDGAFLRSFSVAGRVVNLRVPFAEASTDEDGAFAFAPVGYVRDAEVVVQRDGFRTGRFPLAETSDRDLELVLLEDEAGARTIHGLVLDERGLPVADAHVSFGWTSILSGADGRFALALEEWQESGVLRVVRRGAGASTLAYDLGTDERGRDASDPLTLYLSSELASIRGEVVDANGEPVPGAEVWTPDTTHFGEVVFDGEPSMTGFGTVESILTGRLDGPWQQTVDALADRDGAFELHGVLGREYAVFAWDPTTLLLAGPVMGHPDRGAIRLEIAAEPRARVAGRVVSREGSPLADIRISIGRAIEWARPQRSEDPWAGSPMVPPGAARLVADVAVTDDDGRFDLGEVPTEGTYLSYGGPSVFRPFPTQLANEPSVEALEVVLDARSTFHVTLADPSEADAFRLVTESGGPEPLFVQVEQSTMSVGDVPIVEGRSGVAFTRSGEHVVVLERGGVEVRRTTVMLAPGGVHDVQL